MAASSCAELLRGGGASVSPPPLQTATDSPCLEGAATPASKLGSSPLVLAGVGGGGEGLAGGGGGGADSADDVFSPHKEFHCAVLRALSKGPSVPDQAPGTPDEAAPCLKRNPAPPLPPLLLLPPPHPHAPPRSVSISAAAPGEASSQFSSVLESLSLDYFHSFPHPLSLMLCAKASESFLKFDWTRS